MRWPSKSDEFLPCFQQNPIQTPSNIPPIFYKSNMIQFIQHSKSSIILLLTFQWKSIRKIAVSWGFNLKSILQIWSIKFFFFFFPFFLFIWNEMLNSSTIVTVPTQKNGKNFHLNRLMRSWDPFYVTACFFDFFLNEFLM